MPCRLREEGRGRGRRGGGPVEEAARRFRKGGAEGRRRRGRGSSSRSKCTRKAASRGRPGAPSPRAAHGSGLRNRRAAQAYSPPLYSEWMASSSSSSSIPANYVYRFIASPLLQRALLLLCAAAAFSARDSAQDVAGRDAAAPNFTIVPSFPAYFSSPRALLRVKSAPLLLGVLADFQCMQLFDGARQRRAQGLGVVVVVDCLSGDTAGPSRRWWKKRRGSPRSRTPVLPGAAAHAPGGGVLARAEAMVVVVYYSSMRRPGTIAPMMHRGGTRRAISPPSSASARRRRAQH